MACDAWREKLDAYVDGELAPDEARELSTHMRSCAACAADALERAQMKRSVASAGKRYVPSDELCAKIAKIAGSKARPQNSWLWKIIAVPAMAVLLLSVAVNIYQSRRASAADRVYSELVDLHVATLASTTPVDVVSTDRHTVKPWFQGKIPFTFNLPELQGTPFTLVGGRITYLGQTPGAQLIYQVRKHEISVFIFQDRGDLASGVASGAAHAASFNAESWKESGLRYFVISDVSSDDVAALSKLLRGAG